MDLTFPADSVIVVAGVPGAGKTTLLRRAVDREQARVVDTDDRTRRGPLLYLGHYARIAAAIALNKPAVIHSRGTKTVARRTILALAKLRGRPAHIILMHADREAAEAGQRARGRTVSQAEMDRQVADWQQLLADGGLHEEGWATVEFLTREQAADVSQLRFAPVYAPASAIAV
ncbi:AAA family ATPase [Solirubrobacter sp. CPCC 204708]|uniref:ATP-binding protein n=1 Tax=Solirubrobacter deserti TaxID=2282478 RepID=A0ABT4RTC8_9ACTN|nr:AAA family ATPase [Solirubrobacter deserti]MBE2316210.1 AAA family ATPase [Solirubrobacter deserti]MDA0141836.1 ATP-binding protein [Solirubrobacter deserti]